MVALAIRKDRSSAALRKLAKATGDARVTRRIPAIANALDVEPLFARHPDYGALFCTSDSPSSSLPEAQKSMPNPGYGSSLFVRATRA